MLLVSPPDSPNLKSQVSEAKSCNLVPETPDKDNVGGGAVKSPLYNIQDFVDHAPTEKCRGDMNKMEKVDTTDIQVLVELRMGNVNPHP